MNRELYSTGTYTSSAMMHSDSELTGLVTHASTNHHHCHKRNRQFALTVASFGFVGAVVCVGIGITLGVRWERNTPVVEDDPRFLLHPKYSKFQGLGFQIYTGGAPVYLPDRPTTDDSRHNRNPECFGQTSFGYLDDEDADGVRRNIYCYVGEADDQVDAARRLEIMKQAVERAYQVADPDPTVLKIFNAPEFFWSGKDGAYFFDEADDLDESCGEVCYILMGLEQLTADARFTDWLFLFGTVITAEKLPKEDTWDYMFLNFAPLYRGYDPLKTTHVGQRFLVPKRYVSNMDFLTPLRHYNLTLAREIIDESTPTEIDTTVFNPFLDRGKYSNHVWDSYKQELDSLGYTMIEYDWLIIDGIVFTVEVCLDHDKATALNSYTADVVTGNFTRIPKVDSAESSIEQVPIPRQMAHISLVSSAGMSVNKASIATAHQGCVFLQDGLSDKDPRMFYDEECYTGLTFEGSTELIQRYAVITPHDVLLEYRVHTNYTMHSVFEDDEQDWKTAIRGVFSTVKYEPRISVYPPVEIPHGYPSPVGDSPTSFTPH